MIGFCNVPANVRNENAYRWEPQKKVRSPSLLVAENVLMPNRCLEAAVQCSDEPEPKPLASLNPIFPTLVLSTIGMGRVEVEVKLQLVQNALVGDLERLISPPLPAL